MHQLFVWEYVVATHEILGYVLLFIGLIVEGEIAVIVAGIFAYLGWFSFPVAYTVAIGGGVAKACIGYSIGQYARAHIGTRPWVQKIENRILKFFPRFEKKPFWSIWVSRFFVLGVHLFTTIFSGLRNIPFSTVLKADILSLIPWTALMMGIGYTLGYTALTLTKDIQTGSLIIFVSILTYVIIQKSVRRFYELRRRKQ